jgi:hypothetical protein
MARPRPTHSRGFTSSLRPVAAAAVACSFWLRSLSSAAESGRGTTAAMKWRPSRVALWTLRSTLRRCLLAASMPHSASDRPPVRLRRWAVKIRTSASIMGPSLAPLWDLLPFPSRLNKILRSSLSIPASLLSTLRLLGEVPLAQFSREPTGARLSVRFPILCPFPVPRVFPIFPLLVASWLFVCLFVCLSPTPHSPT